MCTSRFQSVSRPASLSRYLPVSSPPPSGDHSVTPSPSASAIGSSSRSAVRSTRLYSTWTPAIGDQPRMLGDRLRPRDPPGREVRQPRMEDLAAGDEVVEPAQDLLDRRHAVLEVHPVEVDPVGLEPLQAALDRPDHALAVVAGRELRGDDEVVAIGGEEVPEQRLGLAQLIALGGVDQRPARLGEALEHAPRVGRLGAGAPARPEVARPECVLGDPETGQPAERAVVHVASIIKVTSMIVATVDQLRLNGATNAFVLLNTPSGFGYQSHRCKVTRSGCQKVNAAPVSGCLGAHARSLRCGTKFPSS